jgi:serine/threonine protein kinase
MSTQVIELFGQFGRYSLDGELGKAALGQVFLGTRYLDEGQAPVTVLRIDQSVVPADQLELRRQCSILTDLAHPHIVGVIEVINEDNGRVALVLPALNHVSLETVLRTHQLSSVQTVALLTPLANALFSAHASGVMHGSVSPSNILIDSGGKPMLSGFGMMLRSAMTKGLISFEFNLDYVDPDLVGGAALGPMMDQYALGVIGYRCLSGTTPFKAANALGTIRKADQGDYVPLSVDNYGAIAAVIERAMSRAATQRYKNLAAFGTSLSNSIVANKASQPLGLDNVATPKTLIACISPDSDYSWVASSDITKSKRDATEQRSKVAILPAKREQQHVDQKRELAEAEALRLAEREAAQRLEHQPLEAHRVARLDSEMSVAAELQREHELRQELERVELQRAELKKAEPEQIAIEERESARAVEERRNLELVRARERQHEEELEAETELGRQAQRLNREQRFQSKLDGVSEKQRDVQGTFQADGTYAEYPQARWHAKPGARRNQQRKRKALLLVGIVLVATVASGVSYANRTTRLGVLGNARLPKCDASTTADCVANVVRTQSGISVAFADGRNENFFVGTPGDEVRTNNWFCGERATMAMYRPSNGVIYYADGWPLKGASPRVVGDTTGIVNARVGVGDHDKDGCADIALDRNGKRTWFYPVHLTRRLQEVGSVHRNPKALP